MLPTGECTLSYDITLQETRLVITIVNLPQKRLIVENEKQRVRLSVQAGYQSICSILKSQEKKKIKHFNEFFHFLG